MDEGEYMFTEIKCKRCGQTTTYAEGIPIKNIGYVCYDCYEHLEANPKEKNRMQIIGRLKLKAKEKAKKLGFNIVIFALWTILILGGILFLGMWLYAIYCNITGGVDEFDLIAPFRK